MGAGRRLSEEDSGEEGGTGMTDSDPEATGFKVTPEVTGLEPDLDLYLVVIRMLADQEAARSGLFALVVVDRGTAQALRICPASMEPTGRNNLRGKSRRGGLWSWSSCRVLCQKKANCRFRASCDGPDPPDSAKTGWRLLYVLERGVRCNTE